MLLNLGFLILGWGFVQKRGGLSYLVARISRWRSLDVQPSYRSIYYLHRTSQFQQLAIAPNDIVFLGDSITNEGEWTELLPTIPVKNRGISGDTTEGLLHRLLTILAAKPNGILLMIGINDLLNDGKSPDQVSQNHEKILRQIHQHSPDTTVFVQSVLPTNDRLNGRKRDQAIRQLNDRLKALAESRGYTYLDLFTAFVDSDYQLDQQYTEDGVHLNGAGYQTWVKILSPYLLALSNSGQEAGP